MAINWQDDALDDFIQGFFRYHSKAPSEPLRKIWRRGLQGIPVPMLEVIHDGWIRDPARSKRMPDVADFFDAYNAMSRQERQAEQATKPEPMCRRAELDDVDWWRELVRCCIAMRLSGENRQPNMVDLPEWAQAIVHHQIQQARQVYPQGFAGLSAREREDAARAQIAAAVKLYDEELANQFQMEAPEPLI